MKYKIGLRTVKTAIAVSLAITISQFFELDFYATCAIITILCVQTSKKKSLNSASSRFFACMLSIPFTYIFFEGLGFYPVAIGLLLLFFIPTTVLFKINEGVVTSSVIILHIYTSGSIAIPVILNEVALVIIGIGSALFVNVYMPSLDRKLIVKQVEVENKFQHLLIEIAEFLRTNKKLWTEREIIETVDIIKEAKTLAFTDVENNFFKKEDYYYRYFTIREKQIDLLVRMLPTLELVHPMIEQRYIFADFLDYMASYFYTDRIDQSYLERLKRVEEDFRRVPPPENWETFEARAHLLMVVREFEYYLSIMNKLKFNRKKLVFN
ncbi:aromatic acid exporter family protein [Robertmurraya sp. P23]|uniref:aromatic acid exporter family protein n=1 Tax=Robertmurraya sp. P23 TaxID=3436931 RepID=UPI003D9855C3